MCNIKNGKVELEDEGSSSERNNCTVRGLERQMVNK